jgi:hypothetical protein
MIGIDYSAAIGVTDDIDIEEPTQRVIRTDIEEIKTPGHLTTLLHVKSGLGYA